MTLIEWVFTFYLYSMLGWVWEETLVLIRGRRIVNRGFLRGPWLPVYGSGVVMILLITSLVERSVPLIFLMGMLSATVLEYVTGESLAHWLHLRYWDYSKKPMNLRGHVCLSVALGWGAFSVVLRLGIHPVVAALFLRIPLGVMLGADLAISAFFLVDLMLSVWKIGNRRPGEAFGEGQAKPL